MTTSPEAQSVSTRFWNKKIAVVGKIIVPIWTLILGGILLVAVISVVSFLLITPQTSTPEGRARTLAEQMYLKRNIRSVTLSDNGGNPTAPRSLTVEYNGRVLFTNAGLIMTAIYDFAWFIPQVFSEMSEVDYLTVVEYTALTDPKGNSLPAIKLGVSRARAEKINWLKITAEKADTYLDLFNLHPSLDRAWIQVQSKK